MEGRCICLKKKLIKKNKQVKNAIRYFSEELNLDLKKEYIGMGTVNGSPIECETGDCAKNCVLG